MAIAVPGNALHDLAADVSGQSPEIAINGIDQILHAVRTHLGMDVAYVSEFVDGKRIFQHVDAESETPFKVGDSNPLEGSYCQLVADGRLPGLIPDTSAVPAAKALPVTSALPVGAYLGVPIRLRDGRLYGTFCCFNSVANRSLNERDLSIMRAFADLAGNFIERDAQNTRLREEKIARVKSVIEHEQISIVYQPIIRLTDHRIVGFESLSRFSAAPLRTPDIWFSEAADIGLCVELELTAIRLALLGLASLPADLYVAVNVSPATILSGEIGREIGETSAERIVLEITEHAAVSDYSELTLALEPLRRMGLRLAVDDAGAGYSSLQHILQLQPDLIKLDMNLIRDIDKDPAKRALTSALIGFAHQIDCQIVAEGVETEAELMAISELGAQNAQGFFLAYPMPLAKAIQLGRERAA